MTSTYSPFSLVRSPHTLPIQSRATGTAAGQTDFGAVLDVASEDRTFPAELRHPGVAGPLPASGRSGPGRSSDRDCKPETVSREQQGPEFIGTRRLTDIDRAVYADIRKTFQVPEASSGNGTLLSELPMVPWMLSGASGKTVTGDLLTSNIEKATDIFRRHFGSWMSREGIATTPPIELSVSFDGRVVTQADHPDKARIESFINDNGELRNLFVGITSTKNLIEIGRESAAFQARYAVDPKAAVAEYSHFFTGSYTYDTILSIGDSDWSLISSPRWSIT